MEDKKLTPQESMELIASMIQSTRRRVALPDLRISVMWAALSIITAATAWILLSTTHNPLFNFVWFAIPVIGIPASIILANAKREKSGAKTYLDKVSDGVWKCVGYIAIGLTIGCFIAQQCGYPMAWLSMLYYAFIVVGFGAIVSGLLLRENSYVFGGLFSVFSGFAIIICNVCQIPLLYSWVVPLYILCFLLMFIVPAFIISRKLKAEER
ncbi:MAG: hypothetical protein HFJ94_02790 [Muribaculaceae bacterium]|nr:hypothetical protein [Muribaculaceae bacterium]